MKRTIGENIRSMRKKCGFTQEELATMLAVTPQAVSKWENGNGMPDISQLIPLAQIFGITTDALLGVVSSTYGNAHTEAALEHEKFLMASAGSEAEKHLAAYEYFCMESEREPTNYVLMRKCINHGAEISRYTDFEGFLSEQPELLDEIFADCERKNLCISRYCEDRINVEKSDFAMIWIYIHTKQYEKAKVLIERLPSLESNNLKESILAKLIYFQFGFDSEKECILDNVRKLLQVTGKQFCYSLEAYAWHAEAKEAIAFGEKVLHVLDAYKVFEEYYDVVLMVDYELRKLMPRCYAAAGEFEKAAKEVLRITQNYMERIKCDREFSGAESVKTEAQKAINSAMEMVDETFRDKVRECAPYIEAIKWIDRLT